MDNRNGIKLNSKHSMEKMAENTICIFVNSIWGLIINCQAPTHYLSQCWSRSMPLAGVTRPQWVTQPLVLIIARYWYQPLPKSTMAQIPRLSSGWINRCQCADDCQQPPSLWYFSAPHACGVPSYVALSAPDTLAPATHTHHTHNWYRASITLKPSP